MYCSLFGFVVQANLFLQQAAFLKINRISGPVNEVLVITEPKLFETNNQLHANEIIGKLNKKLSATVSAGKMTSGSNVL